MSNHSSIVLDSLLRMNERAQREQANDHLFSEHQDDWRALSFILRGRTVTAASGEMTEIIEIPESITMVPDTPEWMVGLTNFHGEVLPISDLQCFVGGSPIARDYQSKILVIKNRGKYVGLMVPSVLGIRYFPKNSKRQYQALDDRLDLFIYDEFEFEGQVWPVVSMAAILADKQFLME
ncbi:MAG: chemotaxis protein CheW [Pseudomonadales bacterium]|nr:chemotaxis protein CheW [Pseudomonadales bacterium]